MLAARRIPDFSQFLSPVFLQVSRNGHTIRGKPPGVARSLEQRLRDENVFDPILTKKIDIGFPIVKRPRSEVMAERTAYFKKLRSDPEFLKLVKSGKYEIDLEQEEKDYLQTSGPHHIRRIADQFQIFQHLFGDAYFLPRVSLDIKFETQDSLIPVYYGNLLKPEECQQQPSVSFDASFSLKGGDSLWTLLMTNPDGHFEKADHEYVHWLVTNIPGSEVQKGDVLAPYLQPFPPKGTGYHRYVFVLFKQDKKLDTTRLPKVSDPFKLDQRTFKTVDFYRALQDDITPAGLAFFQADYDTSLKDFFHTKLNMKEPIFAYDSPKTYLKDQKWHPIKQSFNLYMDRYRDQLQINKEYLQQKLAETHPFDGPKPPLKFPNAHPIKGVPSWYKTKIQKDRLNFGRIQKFRD